MLDLPLPPGPDPSAARRYLDLLRDGELPNELAAELFAEYGPVVRIDADVSDRVKRYVVTMGAEGNRLLTTSAGVTWGPTIRRSFVVPDGELPYWPSLSTLESERHRAHRRLVLRAFDSSHLADYARVAGEIVDRWASRWRDSIDLFGEMEALAMEVLARTMLGLESSSAEFKGLTADFITWTRIQGNAKDLVGARDRLRHLLGRLATRRRDSPGGDALSALVAADGIESGERLSPSDMVNYGYMLLDFGHADVALFLTYVLAGLACRPDLTDELMVEHRNYTIEAVVAGDRGLPFTVGLLREVERLYPPVTSIRRFVSEPLKLEGYQIPRNTELVASIFMTHRSPVLFPNPEVFDPHRFMPPRKEHRTPFGLMGFGAGPRMCVAHAYTRVVATVVTHHVASRFRFRPPAWHGEPPAIDYGGVVSEPGCVLRCEVLDLKLL